MDVAEDFYRKYYRNLETGATLPERLELNTIHHGDAIDQPPIFTPEPQRLQAVQSPLFVEPSKPPK